jgi:hypothetical protein
MNKVIKLLLTLFLFSCEDPLANRFSSIDNKMRIFAGRHNAKVSTEWVTSSKFTPGGTSVVRYPMKLIVWKDDQIGKAIMIQMHNDLDGLDTTNWDFSNTAWFEGGKAGAKPHYTKSILNKVKFEVIEKNIVQLLSDSEKNLQNKKLEDLK